MVTLKWKVKYYVYEPNTSKVYNFPVGEFDEESDDPEILLFKAKEKYPHMKNNILVSIQKRIRVIPETNRTLMDSKLGNPYKDFSTSSLDSLY